MPYSREFHGKRYPHILQSNLQNANNGFTQGLLYGDTLFFMRIWGGEQWLENFRMTKATFMCLVEHLQPRLERQTTCKRDPIPVEERVAIAVWWLTKTISYRVIGQLFGVMRSTVAGIITEICLAMEAEFLCAVVRPGPPARVSIRLLY